jgi:hypothetical protein
MNERATETDSALNKEDATTITKVPFVAAELLSDYYLP